MVSASIARQLSSGLVGKLHFDFACQRGHGFGEAHMHGAMLEVLTSRLDNTTYDIRSGFAAQALQDPARTGASPGGGRLRELDFAAFPFGTPSALELAIEAKWAGSSHASAENVVKDVCRLAVISKAHPDALCLLVVAGRPSDVNRLMSRKAFAPTGQHRRQVLPYPYHRNQTNLFHLVDTTGGQGLLPRSQQTWLTTKFAAPPHKIHCTIYKPPAGLPDQWTSLVWRVQGFGGA